MNWKQQTADDEVREARSAKFAKCSAVATCLIIVLAITSMVFALTISPPDELETINRVNVIS